MMERENLHAHDIVSVKVGGPEFLRMYDTHDVLASKVACQYSIPFSVAAAILYGRLGVDEFSEAARQDSKLQALIDRVQVSVDPELQELFPRSFSVRLEIHTKDGKVLCTTAGTPWGPDAPPTKDELFQKFCVLTQGIFTEDEQQSMKALYLRGFDAPGSFEKLLCLCEADRCSP